MMKRSSLLLLSVLLSACFLQQPQEESVTIPPIPSLPSTPPSEDTMPKDDAMMEDDVDPEAEKMAADGGDMLYDGESSDAVMMEDDEDDEMTDDEGSEPEASAAGYFALSDDVLTNGDTKVIFFHAPWCPFCVKNDALLKDFYAEEDASISVYKTDFDTSTSLKQKYGIVTQDTFVLVDGDGEKIAEYNHPAESTLLDLLR